MSPHRFPHRAQLKAPHGIALASAQTPVLTAPEAAAYIGCSIDRLNQWAKTGRVDGVFLDDDGRPVVEIAKLGEVAWLVAMPKADRIGGAS